MDAVNHETENYNINEFALLNIKYIVFKEYIQYRWRNMNIITQGY